MSSYSNRQEFEMDSWPELRDMWQELKNLVNSDRTIPKEFKRMLFTMASIAGGCVHCQSHGAYSMDKMNVPTERVKALWSYETSELFTDAERAALDLMRDSSQSPNAVGPEHFERLREHYSAEQIVELVTMSCMAAWLNRWNDTIATVTDQESADWAAKNLTDVGWKLGKHVGEAHEQRKAPLKSTNWPSRENSKDGKD